MIFFFIFLSAKKIEKGGRGGGINYEVSLKQGLSSYRNHTF